ncbi:2-deoxystreptamine glucosyltransferase [Roseovarius litorisediminis]|uniref:2-deoxystreptamine glucosyltransferase n=2 Tax=Roseovarius litorisediminis TaxID=1312363 RepID=A0A1Y5TNT0_9RHOB|nr:2-deoxystreptamine glucosyltransferase [Roseovarius litorisediminis]
MRIGYLLNTYPVTSSTFIRREMEALENLGFPIKRLAIRRWSEPLVDKRDKAEQDKTTYILSGQIPRLIFGFFREAVTNPMGLGRAICGSLQLIKNARGGLVRNIAYLLEAISLKRHAAANSIDHIHTHFSTNAAAVALLSHRLGGPGYSFTVHGPDELIDWSLSSLAMKVREARFVVAISNFCKSQLLLAAGPQALPKIKISRCGLPVEEFDKRNESFEGNPPFVSVGRLCPQKAQVLLIEAVAKVAATHPEIRVQMIGDGESRADVEAAINRHGLLRNVELLGWRDNHEVCENLAKGRALLLPSIAEGLPVVIMEAFALGRPVISTFIAGIPELVDNKCGWIIPAGSVDHIAEALIQALETPPKTLAKMGREGRQRVQEMHDIQKNAAILAENFRDVRKR